MLDLLPEMVISSLYLWQQNFGIRLHLPDIRAGCPKISGTTLVVGQVLALTSSYLGIFDQTASDVRVRY